MELSLDLAVQIASMVLICAVGFLLSRAHLVSANESRLLSVLCVYFFGPCAIAGAFQSELNPAQLSGLALTCVSALLMHAVIIASSHLLRLPPLRFTPEERGAAIYSNSGNLAIPMIVGISSLGSAYVFYTGGFMAMQTFLIWSHGQSLMGGGTKLNVKKIISNPCMIACFVGLIIFFGQITLPSPVSTAMANSGACLGPSAMLIIGMTLGEADIHAVFSNRRVYFVVFIRLVVFPLTSIAVLALLGLVWAHPDLHNISVVVLISAIGPVASTIAQQAQLYNSPHTAHMSAINLVSTLLCAITMPVMILLYQFAVGM